MERRGKGAHIGQDLKKKKKNFMSREQTMVSWNNAADESLSKQNKALTSWVLKAHS